MVSARPQRLIRASGGSTDNKQPLSPWLRMLAGMSSSRSTPVFFAISRAPINGKIQPVTGWRQTLISRFPRSRAGWGGTIALHLGLLAFALFSMARLPAPTAGTSQVIAVALEPLSPNTDARDSLISTTQPGKVREPPTRADPATTVAADATRQSREGIAPEKPAEPAAAPENSASAPNQSPDSEMTTANETPGASANQLLSMLLNQIRRCWVPPLGTAASTTILHFEVFLNFDGSVAQPPQLLAVTDDSYFRAAADAARRAIYACAPYKLPAGRFSEWHVINDLGITPALMAGG